MLTLSSCTLPSATLQWAGGRGLMSFLLLSCSLRLADRGGGGVGNLILSIQFVFAAGGTGEGRCIPGRVLRRRQVVVHPGWANTDHAAGHGLAAESGGHFSGQQDRLGAFPGSVHPRSVVLCALKIDWAPRRAAVCQRLTFFFSRALINCRWQMFGVHVPSEVHWGVRGHQSQCRRAIGRLFDADPTEEGAQLDSGEQCSNRN